MSVGQANDANADARCVCACAARCRASASGPSSMGSATRYGLAGFVRNDQDGVMVEIEGASVDDFVERLRRELPPLARIDAMEVEPLRRAAMSGFRRSATAARTARRDTRFPPMSRSATPASTNCSIPPAAFTSIPSSIAPHCGPRYTLTRASAL